MNEFVMIDFCYLIIKVFHSNSNRKIKTLENSFLNKVLKRKLFDI